MPKIILNGEEVDFEPGQTVIEVAFERGLNVPHYCWHPALPVVASCRICQVEVEGPAPGQKRLVTACNTPCTDGLKVETATPAVAKARAGNLEALLLNHPLDCPICDKAGECWLQDYAYEYGAAAGRNEFPRRKLEKRKDIGEHILLDQERCILCTRCTRFMEHYAGKPELIVAERGEHSYIDIFPGHPLTSDYQGNLADICPVGALTIKEFRFKNRVWYLKGVDSVCTLCSRGCSITLDVRNNELNRVRPRTNPDVNGYFICDEGRFGLLERYHPSERVTGCLIDGAPATLDQAAKAFAERVRDTTGPVLLLVSPDSTNEEAFALRAIAEGAPALSGRCTIGFQAVPEGPGDGILRTGQKAANVAGLRALQIKELSPDDVRAAMRDASAVLSLDDRLDAVDGSPEVLAVLGVLPPLRNRAHIVLAGATHGERDGSLTNTDGVTQHLRPALRPPPGVVDDYRTLFAIGEALSAPGLHPTPDAAFQALADAFGRPDLTLAGLPSRGVRLGDQARELQP